MELVLKNKKILGLLIFAGAFLLTATMVLAAPRGTPIPGGGSVPGHTTTNFCGPCEAGAAPGTWFKDKINDGYLFKDANGNVWIPDSGALDSPPSLSDLNPLGSGGSGRVARTGCIKCGGYQETNKVVETADSKADQSGARSGASIADRTWKNWENQKLVEALKKQLMDRMVAEIVRWIQGNNGKPLFVENWAKYLGDAVVGATDAFLRDTADISVCAPFQNLFNKVTDGLASNDNSYKRSLTCTLDDIVENVDDFYNDFSKGGWRAYESLLEPQNNIYGQYLLAQDELTQRTIAASHYAEIEATVGQGILGPKDCEEAPLSDAPNLDGDPYMGDIPGTCVTATPPILVAELAKRAVGSDFDLLVNANQLESYISKLASALFKRLIGEVGGFRSTNTSDAASDTYVPSPNDLSPCREFEPGSDVRNACEDLIEFSDNDFENAREQALSEVDEIIGPLRQSLTLFAFIKNSLRELKTYLIAVDTTRSVCVTDPMLSGVDDKISEIDQSASSTEAIIDSFTPIQGEILALEVGDWGGLVRARKGIEATGFNAAQADTFYEETLLFEDETSDADNNNPNAYVPSTKALVSTCSGIDSTP